MIAQICLKTLLLATKMKLEACGFNFSGTCLITNPQDKTLTLNVNVKLRAKSLAVFWILRWKLLIFISVLTIKVVSYSHEEVRK